MLKITEQTYVVVTIVQYPECISWSIRGTETEQSGSDPLSSTNGCYMSLFSNVMTDCSNRSLGPIDEWIVRKG